MRRLAISAAVLGAAFLLSSVSAVPAGTGVPPDRQPVVVELFTSQGCSSCPPANANLIALAESDDILALSFSVTYWDYLGWKDVFGRPDYTARQVIYEPKLRQNGPFTPQMVVDGRASAIGFDLVEMRKLIDASPRKHGPTLMLAANRVDVGAATSKARSDVWLVWYDPKIVQVPVLRGENSHRTLPHSHVVHGLTRLGGWNGQAAAFEIPPAPAGLRVAILVQETDGGPIIAAATD